MQRRDSPQPVITAKEAMRCVIEVRVTNRGSRTVHGARAFAPFVGPGTGTVVLVFNPDGCNEGGTMRVPGWPTLVVDSLGRSHEVPSDQDFAFQRRRATPGCPT